MMLSQIILKMMCNNNLFCYLPYPMPGNRTKRGSVRKFIREVMVGVHEDI